MWILVQRGHEEGSGYLVINTRMQLIANMLLPIRECVQCRTFGTGEKKETCEKDCSYFNLIKVKDRDKLPQPNDAAYPVMHCKERDANDCWFYYTYAVNNNTEKEVHVVDTLGKCINWFWVQSFSVALEPNYRGRSDYTTKIDRLFFFIV